MTSRPDHAEGCPQLSGGIYEMVVVADSDAPRIQELLERCEDYFLMDRGAPAGPRAALETLQESPSGVGDDARFAFGILDAQGQPVGLLTGLRDYPGAGTFWIGLLLLDPAERRHGLGSNVLDAMVRWVRGQHGSELRVTVHDVNELGARFWSRHGLVQTSSEVRDHGLRHRVHVMTRAL